MNAPLCSREAELLDAIASGTWPEASAAELRDHVTVCAGCADLALVATSIADDRRESESHAAPPPSGALWWRMQMRMERESRETAVRTVRRAHGVVVLATIALLVPALAATRIPGAAWSWIVASLSEGAQLVTRSHVDSPLALLVIGLAGVALFAPAIVWLTFAKE